MKIIGHRGAKGLAPENTVASFRRALECGVDGIELDVHLTSDGVLVCTHDAAIIAPDGTEYAIPNHTYDELLAQKPDLATLDEAIMAVNRKVPIVIEIKKGTPTEPVITTVQDYLDRGWQMDDFEFCAFEQPPLVELHDAFPRTELIVNERWSSVRATWRARQLHSRRISMKAKWLWRGYLRMMRRGGWKVSSFIINDVTRARKWEPYLYSIYTDYPDRFTRES
jgi:glycerophosphoryl diester phosphodiesterase